MHCFLPTIDAEEKNGIEDALACDDGGQMAMLATLDIWKPKNRRQAMESLEWDKWRKAEATEILGMVENFVYKQVARPKDKLVVGTKCSTSEKSDRMARSRSTSAGLSLKDSGRWKVYTIRKSTRPR